MPAQVDWNDRMMDGYTDDGKAKDNYHKKARAIFKKLANNLGLKPGQFSIRTNKAGPAVIGETTLHAENIYVQVGSTAGILYRSCNGQKDYSGGHNNWAPNEMMDDLDALTNRIRPEMERAQRSA